MVVEDLKCQEVFEKLMIYADGRVALCCVDDNCYFDIGNAFEQDPVEIFNNEIFNKYRNYMEEGRIMELEHCKNCSIPRSKYRKQFED